MDVKKNIPLILGLSIPIIMILFVAGSIYLPGLFIQPKFNFLYATGENYYYNRHYSVQNGRLIKNEFDYPEHYTGSRTEPRLYIHDIVKNESQEISFSEAQKLTLNSNSQSPDGFEIDCGRRTQGIFFIFVDLSRDCSTRFIKGHNTSKKLNIQRSGSSYGYFQFLGWIIE
jgi:hypothetical protein